MWTVVYIAPNLEKAELLNDLLTEEGLMVMLRPMSNNCADDGSVEILVSESEAEEAHLILLGMVLI